MTLVDEDEAPVRAWFCPDCGAMFPQGEYGFDEDKCVDCGGNDCYEVPG